MREELKNLKETVEDLIILSINAEMEEYEPMRVLASEVRNLAERMKRIISEMEEKYGKGDDSR